MSDLNPYEEGLAIDLAKAEARIKELQAQRNFAQRQVVVAETKLAKAVGLIQFLDKEYQHVWGVTARSKVRTTLAELKGQGDDN